MTIKMKLLVGFLGISIICLAVGPVALKVSQNGSINHSIQATSAQIEMIKTREIDHHQWLAGLDRLFLENEAELNIQVDDHKCSLGKFLYGPELDRLRNEAPEEAAYFDIMKSDHALLHESAKTIGNNWHKLHPGLESTLFLRLSDHHKWANTLATNLMAGREPGVEINPEKCEFGQWLKSDEAKALKGDSSEFENLLTTISQEHILLHQSAKVIGSTKDLASRSSIFESQTIVHLRKVGTYFHDLIAVEHSYGEIQSEARDVYHAETVPAMKNIQKVMKDAIAQLSQKRANLLKDQAAASQRQTAFTWGGSLLAIFIGSIIAIWIIRSIVGPINKTVSFTEEFGKGDLSQRLNYQANDELGQMTGALDKMADSLELKAKLASKIAQGDLTEEIQPISDKDTLGIALRDMNTSLQRVVSQAVMATREVDQGAEQLSSTSQSLAEGATEQAASLEETHASVTEIRDQAKESARMARESAATASSAANAADKSKTHMHEMGLAMADIESASSEIGKIIKVIDDIAFQTNLLALNAAVEAARAGKHGKGFAVVAEEVRTLAQRSAKAARETSSLITGSGEKVDHGTKVVEQTTEALEQVVGSIREISSVVSSIAISNEQQSEAVSQITIALEQIDQATQSSTASAEETASVSEELSAQAKLLAALMGHFEIDGVNVPVADDSIEAIEKSWEESEQGVWA